MREAARQARNFSLTTLVRANAQRRPHALAVVDGSVRVSYRALEQRTNRLAHGLAARGVGPGHRVASLLPDGLPAIELLLACGKLGAIAVTLNWRLSPGELSAILANANPRLLVYHERFVDLIREVPESVSRDLVREDAPPDEAFPQLTGLASDAPHPFVAEPFSPLYMLFTSGTTGRPKGCLHSHASVAISALSFVARRGLNSDDVLFSQAPLFHVGGLSHLFAALSVGAATVVAPRGASADQLLALISEERCTFACPVAPVLREIVEAQRQALLPLRLRTLTRGATMVSVDEIEDIREHLGADVTGGYGQSEVGGFATMVDRHDMLLHPKAIGFALPHLESTILDSDGAPTDSNEGELGLRGASVMLGYWRDPATSYEAVEHGWLRTGDLVRRDEEGRLHFEGRSKELIKTAGENVYPREVELVLIEHPAVADAAVCGAPHPRWGEAVKAFVVLQPGAQATAAEIAAWCKQRIAGYKQPRFVEFIDALPRDQLGKLQRRLLQDRPTDASQDPRAGALAAEQKDK